MGVYTYILCKLPMDARNYKETALWANSYSWFGSPPKQTRHHYKKTLGVDEGEYFRQFKGNGCFEIEGNGFRFGTIYRDSFLKYLDNVKYSSIEDALIERKQTLWSIQELYFKVKYINPVHEPVEFLVFPENSIENLLEEMKGFSFDGLIEHLKQKELICRNLKEVINWDGSIIWHGVLNAAKTEINLKDSNELIWKHRTKIDNPLEVGEWEYMDLLHTITFIDSEKANKEFVFRFSNLQSGWAKIEIGIGEEVYSIHISSAINDAIEQLLENMVKLLDGRFIYYKGIQGEQWHTLIYCDGETSNARIYLRNMGQEMLVLVWGNECPFLSEDLEDMAFIYGFNAENALYSNIKELNNGLVLALKIDKKLFSTTVFDAYKQLMVQYGTDGIKERWYRDINTKDYTDFARLVGVTLSTSKFNSFIEKSERFKHQ